MAPSLHKMFGKLTLHKKKSGQEDTNSSTPLLQRSDDDLKTRAQQQQQQQQQQHQEREEEYQRLFPKRNDIQHDDDEDKTDQPDPTTHPVLRPKSSFPASGKRFLPRKKFLVPTSKFAVSQPPLPEPSSIPERDEHLPTVATPSVTYPDCRPPVKRVQARGCLFDIAPMPLSSHPPVDEKEDSSQPEGMQQSSPSSPSSSTTTTTHHRQERADSHQEDVTTPTTATNPEVTSRDFASTPRDALTVPALTIRKNLLQPPSTSTTSTSTSTTSTRIPSSPRSSPHSPSEKMSVPPQTAENERKRDSEAAYTTAKMASPTTTTTTTTFREKLWGAVPSSSSAAAAASNNNKNDKASAGSKTFGLRDQTRLIPAAGTAAGGATGGKAPLPSSSSSPISSSGAIPVRPPLYDFHKPAGLQWASPGITNSRPAAPWVSSKKKEYPPRTHRMKLMCFCRDNGCRNLVLVGHVVSAEPKRLWSRKSARIWSVDMIVVR